MSILKKEASKGFSLPKLLFLDKRSETILPFYLTIPGNSLGTALHIHSNYRTPKDFVHSAQATMLRKAGLVDIAKVKKIQLYLRKTISVDTTNQ